MALKRNVGENHSLSQHLVFFFSYMPSPSYYLPIMVEKRNTTTCCFFQTSSGDNEKEMVRR